MGKEEFPKSWLDKIKSETETFRGLNKVLCQRLRYWDALNILNIKYSAVNPLDVFRTCRKSKVALFAKILFAVNYFDKKLHL